MKEIWSSIHDWLTSDQRVMLMLVIDSQGSSPGRIGFKMAVSEGGEMTGSIGGGIMEHKLVELCKEQLLSETKPLLKRQIHRTDIPKDRSGMICSGEQSVAFYLLGKDEIQLMSVLASADAGVLTGTQEGLLFDPKRSLAKKHEIVIEGPENWSYQEDIGLHPDLHIIGGGHVSLALSKFAVELGFTVSVYDDRKELNTFNANQFAKCVAVQEYEKITDQLEANESSYVVLMSFGYRTDKTILKQLLAKNFKYLGMMGSKEKVMVLFKELLAEGYSQDQIGVVHSPIGLPINSKTPEEITVSVLAEMIQVKNKKMDR